MNYEFIDYCLVLPLSLRVFISSLWLLVLILCSGTFELL